MDFFSISWEFTLRLETHIRKTMRDQSVILFDYNKFNSVHPQRFAALREQKELINSVHCLNTPPFVTPRRVPTEPSLTSSEWCHLLSVTSLHFCNVHLCDAESVNIPTLKLLQSLEGAVSVAIHLGIDWLYWLNSDEKLGKGCTSLSSIPSSQNTPCPPPQPPDSPATSPNSSSRRSTLPRVITLDFPFLKESDSQSALWGRQCNCTCAAHCLMLSYSALSSAQLIKRTDLSSSIIKYSLRLNILPSACHFHIHSLWAIIGFSVV